MLAELLLLRQLAEVLLLLLRLLRLLLRLLRLAVRLLRLADLLRLLRDLLLLRLADGWLADRLLKLIKIGQERGAGHVDVDGRAGR